MRFAVLAACLALAACAHHPVDPPADRLVAVSCVPPDAAAAPAIHRPEELARAPDGPTRYVLTAADYLALYAWSIQAAPILEACRAAAGP